MNCLIYTQIVICQNLKIQANYLQMKKIVIIGGDPNSVNSELIYKVWKNSKKKLEIKFIWSRITNF